MKKGSIKQLKVCPEKRFDIDTVRTETSSVQALTATHIETFSQLLQLARQFEDSVQRLGKIILDGAENSEDDENAGEDLEERPTDEYEDAEISTYHDQDRRYKSFRLCSTRNAHMPNIGDGKKRIYQCIERLAHASQCTNPYCSIEGCCAMKTCVEHYLKCCIGTKNGCSICVQLMSVCVYHTRTCRNKSCGVPFCREIKQQVKSLQGVSKKRGTPTVKTPIVSSPKSVMEPEINAITNNVTNRFHLTSSSDQAFKPPDQMSEYDTFAMRNPLSYTHRNEAETKTRFFPATHGNVGQVFDDFFENVSDSSMQPVIKECIDALRYTSTANGANYVQSGESIEVPRTSTPQLPYTRTQSLGQINPNQWAAEKVHQTFKYTSTANGANYVQPGESIEVPRTSTPQLPYTRTQSLGQINPNRWAAEEVHHTLRNTSTANEANFVQPGDSGEVSKTSTPQLPCTRTKSLGQIDPNQWAAEDVYDKFKQAQSLPSFHPKFDDKHNDEVFINKYLVEPGFMFHI